MGSISVSLRADGEREVFPGDVSVTAHFENSGDGPASLNLSQASHPALVLEVQDEGGKRVHFQPPSAPDEADLRPTALNPGESFDIRYAGFLDHGLPSGEYKIRYFSIYPELGGTKDEPLESDWLSVRIHRSDLPEATVIIEGGDFRPGSLVSAGRPVRNVIKKISCALLRLLNPRLCRRVLEGEVDETRTETISDAPPGAEAWNGTYDWHARFHIRVSEQKCRVDVTIRIRTIGTVTADQQTAWRDAIADAWSNRFKLCPGRCCCTTDGFGVFVRAEFVTSGEHQVVNAGSATTNMGNWGADDTVDVRHEFGHMLGALDEYFTVNGVDFGDGRQPDGNIMNNPENDPVARHYDVVRDAAGALLGTTCRTVPVGRAC